MKPILPLTRDTSLKTIISMANVFLPIGIRVGHESAAKSFRRMLSK